MNVRDLTPADGPGLATLLGDADHPDYHVSGARLHGPPLHGNGRWRRTLVAVAGDRVVGAVTAARWRLHPDRMLSAVHVAPDHRRRGMARDLLDRIRRMAEQRPLAGKLRAGDAAGRGLVTALGGRVYQSCPGLQPDPTSEPVRRWCAEQPVPLGVRLVPMRDANQEQRIAAWTATYRWGHESWSPVDQRVLREMAPQMLADLDPVRSVLALREGSAVTAGAWVFRQPDGTVVVVADTTGPDEPAGTAVVAATLAACLHTLADAGVTTTLLDGHDTDVYLAPVMRTLPAGDDDPVQLVEIPPIT